MSSSCVEKMEEVKKWFTSCSSPVEKYQKIMELGRKLPPPPQDILVEENIVPGCQSIVYLCSELTDGKIFFTAKSDALISAGLAALLIHVYNGEPPETLIQCKPIYIEELDIPASLSPGRSNGLFSMFTRMQKLALQSLMRR